MIQELANYCQILEEQYLTLNLDEISAEVIEEAIRKAILSGRVVPLLCGSALRNKGIQPLLDAIVKYLPSPERVDGVGINSVTNQVVTR